MISENVHRTIMLYGSPDVTHQKRLVLYQLLHNDCVRKYIKTLYNTYNVRNSPYSDLIEAFFRVQECHCCGRHQRARPCSPYDGRLFPRQPTLAHKCKCKCRFLLRSIADEVVTPSI